MGVTVDEYTALEARVNHDGTVDVLVNGSPVPAGSGLTMAAVLELLTRYAAENGKLLMTTTHPNGRVTRDLVSETGEVTPFYPDARTRVSAVVPEAEHDPSHDELYQVLKKSGRRLGYADIAAREPVQAVAPSTTRVMLGEGAVPKFDVEADIEKALSAKKPPMSKAKMMILALVITIAVLGGLAVAGWMFFTGYDFRGPLPTSLGSLPHLPLL